MNYEHENAHMNDAENGTQEQRGQDKGTWVRLKRTNVRYISIIHYTRHEIIGIESYYGIGIGTELNCFDWNWNWS